MPPNKKPIQLSHSFKRRIGTAPILLVSIKRVACPTLGLIGGHDREGDQAENQPTHPQTNLRLPPHRLPLRPPNHPLHHPRPPVPAARFQLHRRRRIFPRRPADERRRGRSRHAHLLPHGMVQHRRRRRRGRRIDQSHPVHGRGEGPVRRLMGRRRWATRRFHEQPKLVKVAGVFLFFGCV